MHRDTQIGLAMAIVLIGFAAALCFPRETPDQLASLPAPEARELDRAIEQLPVRAYTGIEHPNASPAGSPDRPQWARNAPPVVVETVRAAPAAPIASTDLTPSPPRATSSVETRFAAVAKTAAGETPSVDASAIPMPQSPGTPLLLQPVDQHASGISAIAPADTGEPESPAAGRESFVSYIVQPGDTLSGIALRFLGGVGRYPEIFDANRDRLTTPDSLQPGMALRIPSR